MPRRSVFGASRLEVLFVLAACLFMVIRHHYGLLEKAATRSQRELAVRDLKLEKLTSALSGQARSEIIAINTTSQLLLENYGGFLPRQGHEYAEQMKEAAIQIERLRLDLVGSLGRGAGGQAAQFRQFPSISEPCWCCGSSDRGRGQHEKKFWSTCMR